MVLDDIIKLDMMVEITSFNQVGEGGWIYCRGWNPNYMYKIDNISPDGLNCYLRRYKSVNSSVSGGVGCSKQNINKHRNNHPMMGYISGYQFDINQCGDEDDDL